MQPGLRHWVAGGPVGYKHGMRDGTQEKKGTRGRGSRSGQKPRTFQSRTAQDKAARARAAGRRYKPPVPGAPNRPREDKHLPKVACHQVGCKYGIRDAIKRRWENGCGGWERGGMRRYEANRYGGRKAIRTEQGRTRASKRNATAPWDWEICRHGVGNHGPNMGNLATRSRENYLNSGTTVRCPQG